jgi:hypothetical protein
LYFGAWQKIFGSHWQKSRGGVQSFMAVVFYLWLIPLALLVVGGLGSLYLCIKRDWPAGSESEKRSDLEIALEMEAREAEAEARAPHSAPLGTVTGSITS